MGRPALCTRVSSLLGLLHISFVRQPSLAKNFSRRNEYLLAESFTNFFLVKYTILCCIIIYSFMLFMQFDSFIGDYTGIYTV